MAGVLAVSQQHGNLSKNAENVEFGDDNASTGSLDSGNNGSNGLGDMDASGDDLGPHSDELLAQQHTSRGPRNHGSGPGRHSRIAPVDVQPAARRRATLPVLTAGARYQPVFSWWIHFEPHRDKHALAANVLFGSDDAFQGGGTAFWREDDVACEPTFNLRPAVGVGVVFGGTVKQAGLAVRSGVRHVLVASFNIADKRIYGWCGSSLIMERVHCCIQ